MNDFQTHKLYRLSHLMDNKNLRGRAVVFLGYVDRSFDIRRAKVRDLKTDEEWLVSPHHVIPLDPPRQG